MGHYRSEMVSPGEHVREIDEREAWLSNRAKRIEEGIADKGLARVLAEILDNPTVASIRYHGHPTVTQEMPVSSETRRDETLRHFMDGGICRAPALEHLLKTGISEVEANRLLDKAAVS